MSLTHKESPRVVWTTIFEFWGILLADRQVSTRRLEVLVFFYPNAKTSSIMSPDLWGFSTYWQTSLPPQDWGFVSFFTPNAKFLSIIRNIIPPGADNPLVKPNSTSAHHHRDGILRPSQDRGFWSFFYPYAKTYTPPDAHDPLVKPKGTRAYHRTHPSRQFFLDFLDFF